MYFYSGFSATCEDQRWLELAQDKMPLLVSISSVEPSGYTTG